MIVVSHRGPVSFSAQPNGSFLAHRGAGGLVSALRPLLEGTGATWVAAAISEDDRAAVRAGAARAGGSGFELCLLDLEPAAHRLHYEVISNGVLWPAVHSLFDLVRHPRFDRRTAEAWDAYVAVNEAFAAAVDKVAAEGDLVLVHDYQLALVPGALRATRPDLAVVHFTHTPMCGPDGIRVLPDAMTTPLCSSMASVPAGFHTARWVRNYRSVLAEILGADVGGAEAFAAALGPDTADLARVAAGPEGRAAADALADRVGDQAVILRIDRMEPSKNIVRGFAAYDLLLETQPEWRQRVTFLAHAYPSREGLANYRAYRREVEQAAARVNDRWARGDWQPVILDTADDHPASVAALGRFDVLLVNPVLDGLNLVAKEGPLLNRFDGVLCLSRGAGAFAELGGAALEVHPFDLVQTAAALHAGLSMPAGERAARARRLRALAATRSPRVWLDDLVAHAPR